MKIHFLRNFRPLGALLAGLAIQAAAPLAADPILTITEPVGTDALTVGRLVPVVVSIAEAEVPINTVNLLANGSPVGGAVPSAEGWLAEYRPMSTGSLSLSVEAVDADGATWVSDAFTFNVGQTSGPAVSILAPVSGSRYLPGTNLPVQVSARDDDGLVRRVDFFLNDNQVASVTAPPFRTEIQLPSIGSYTLKARATDDLGGQTYSEAVILEAGPVDETSPRVVIDFPLPLGNGDTVNDVSYASAMFLNAVATDPDGSIETVNFYINGQLLGEADHRVGDVYSYFYDPNALGNYLIAVEAIDNDGNASWSVPLPLDVGPLERPLPTAEMVQPFPESILGRIVGLFVEADGGLIAIDRVDFFANGVYLGSSTEPVVDNLYSLNWVPEEPGEYDLQTRVVQIDPEGATWDNWRISEPVVIDITEPPGAEQPSISILNPVDGDTSVIGQSIWVQADGLDPLGSVREVRYYVNGRQEDFVDTRYPYSFTFEPQSPGQYQFVAEMLTDRGLRVQSDPVMVGVVATDKPDGQIILPNGDNPTAGSDIRVEVDASDPDGFIETVQLFVNSQPLPDTFWRPQSPGIYDLSARLRDNSGNETQIERSVTVGPQVGTPPRVTLSVTGSGNVTPGSRVVVRANVFDDDPTDMSVAFLLNGELIGIDETAPYSTIVDPEVGALNGAYSLTAVASDRDGNSRADNLTPLYISDFSVDQPSIDILNLDSGDEVTLGSRVPIRVDVSGGAAANLEWVVFYADGVEIGRLPGGEPTGKYTLDWNPERLGPARISVASLLRTESFDHDDDRDTPFISVTPVNVASPVDLTVNEAIGNLPSISLDVSPANANLAIGSRVMLYADAQDLGGGVDQVEFFVDGVQVGTDTEAPFTHILTTTRQGDFPLNAIATDSEGNVVTSTVVNLNVVSRVITRTPSISLTVPESGREGSLLSLRASTEGFVNPPEGLVFYGNGQPIGGSQSLPYSYSWLANLNGPVTFFSTARQTLFDGALVTTVSNVVDRNLATNEVPVIREVGISFPNQSASKPNPLGGEPILFSVSVDDSGALRSVELLRNGEPIQESESAASPFEFTDTPPGLGTYEYSILVTDRGGLQAQSEAFPVTVVVGEPPSVALTSPDPGEEFRPGTEIVLRATASDIDGTISEVDFLVNGTSTGEAVTERPFEQRITAQNPGTYTLVARARDNSGNLSSSEQRTFVILEEDKPDTLLITGFTVDTGADQVLVGTGIDIEAAAEDAESSIERISLLVGGEVVETANRDSALFRFVPEEAGVFSFQIRAVNTEGFVVESEPVEVSVRYPDPVGIDEDFVYQTFIDLLLRTPTQAEQDSYTARIVSGDLTRARFVRELIDPADGQEVSDYDAVRSALLANRLLLETWPDRQTLVSDTGVIRDTNLTALVTSLMPDFESTYVAATGQSGVPDAFSPDAEIGAYVDYLFERKYGVLPTADQMALGLLQFRASGRDAFTAAMIADVEVVATGNGFVTIGLGFQFPAGSPPNDRYIREADAASLLINFLRVTPDGAEVESLADRLFAAQVDEVVGDPRYMARFSTAFMTLEHHAGSWKHSEWFGWFNTAHDPWVYHAEHGWVSFDTVGQFSGNLWYFDAGMGWVWTQADLYPVIYEQGRNSWMMTPRWGYIHGQERWFFDFGSGQWVTR